MLRETTGDLTHSHISEVSPIYQFFFSVTDVFIYSNVHTLTQIFVMLTEYEEHVGILYIHLVLVQSTNDGIFLLVSHLMELS